MVKSRIIIVLFLLLACVIITIPAKAQISFGLGGSGLKYLGSGSVRPTSAGINAMLGIDINTKARIVLTATEYFPVTYTYNDTFKVNGVPAISHEEFKNLQTSALVMVNLIGSNADGSLLYVEGGPSIMFYNTTVTRDNVTTYNYAQNFKDYMIDLRAGTEIPLGIIRIFGEGEIGAPVFSDVKTSAYYSPHKGPFLAASVGLRIHI